MSQTLLNMLRGIVGEAHVLLPTDGDPLARHAHDWRKKYFGKPLCVVRPSNTQEVSAVVKACHAVNVAMVPQGGNTGLVGGGVPDASGSQVVLSLGRMTKILAVDTLNNTMTVEAGVVLQTIQEEAARHDRLFPLSLAAEGSCTIGGNVATNAGGVQVLRYGNTRDLVLGIETVLPNGEIWDGMRGLRKDNTGYDLKHLFIGSEGSLGLVTRAVLKLFPAPRAQVTAVVGLNTPARSLALLNRLKSATSERLAAFEIISARCLQSVLRFFPDARNPLSGAHAWYVLLEVADGRHEAAVRDDLEAALGEALDAGEVQDVAVAASLAQSKAMWMLRESIPEAQVHEGKNIKHDVALPISRLVEFIATADAALEAAYPNVRIFNFGHVGDGNLHYNISHPLDGYTVESWMAEWEKVSRIVHDIVHALGGSISAEHGLGQMKREEIMRYKSITEMNLMRAVKQALDPKGLMNPGKVV
jgi:FAD/FMN-containing dehydrogenase